MEEITKLEELQEALEEEQKDNKRLIELATGEKLFNYTKETHGFDTDIKIKLPSLTQRNRAEMLYSKLYNRLLQDEDYLTNSQILSIAESRGVLTKDDQEELVTIDRKIKDVKNKIEAEKVEKKKEKYKEELSSLRDKKFRLAIRIGSLTSTSIENIAEHAKIEYLILSCIFDVSGEVDVPLYKSKEDLEQETNLTKLQRILFDARSVWFGEGLADFLQLDD